MKLKAKMFKFDKPIEFNCFNCKKKKKSKNVATTPNGHLCNGCYGELLSKNEIIKDE